MSGPRSLCSHRNTNLRGFGAVPTKNGPDHIDKNPAWVYSYGCMKVIFKCNVDCDYYDHSLEETYPKYFRKWDEVRAEDYADIGGILNIMLPNGDIISEVPPSAVEIK